MKKTLTLLSLLGAVAMTPLYAEIVSWSGVTCAPDNRTLSGAEAAYKHASGDGQIGSDGRYDYNMCGPSSAANVLSWWLDQVEQSGALIIPDSVPRGTDVWEEVRLLYLNKPITPAWVMQYWLTGCLSSMRAGRL